MYYAHRTDDNQADIVSAFRHCGWKVFCSHTYGRGFTDLICGKHGFNLLVEVKDSAKTRSGRKFTRQQKLFHDNWEGAKCVVKDTEEVEIVNRAFNTLHAMIAQPLGVFLEAITDPEYI